MGKSCCVISCTSKYEKGNGLHFYLIPKEPDDRRKLWIAAIKSVGTNGQQWEPKDHYLVCSRHFIKGTKSNDPENPDYVPSINMGYSCENSTNGELRHATSSLNVSNIENQPQQGSISYVSKAFGGRTSDKVITQHSGYLDKIEHDDQVLADRGFLIAEELANRNATLIIPAFTKGKSQLSAKEVETTRTIAHVRIHVERAIERLKNFNILCTNMSMYMVPHADSIVTICSAICNLQPKLVS